MVAINMLAFNYIGNESSSIRVHSFPVVDLLATFLNAFLLPLYTMKESQNISEYYTLPAGKITKTHLFNNQFIINMFVCVHLYFVSQLNLYWIG